MMSDAMRYAIKCFELTIFDSGNLGMNSQSLWSSNCGRKLRHEAFSIITDEDENVITTILGLLTFHNTCCTRTYLDHSLTESQ